MFELLDELIGEKKRVDELLREKGETSLKETMKNVFAKHPDLKGVRWDQYTPYFNDGDECIFRIGEIEFDMTGDMDWNDISHFGYSKWDSESRSYKKVPPHPYYSFLRELSSKIYSLKDMFKAVFGDHTKITVTPDTIKVVEYSDHD